MITTDPQRRLEELVDIIPRNFDELVISSREIINCWINAGFDYPNALVEAFVSIDSQADCLRASDDTEEKESFYQVFRAIYMNELEILRSFLARPKG